MKVFLYFVIFSSCTNNLKANFEDVEGISMFRSYQITIFNVNDDHTGKMSKKQNFFFRKMTNCVATVIIDLDVMEYTKDNRSLSMPVFKNPRESTTYIILTDDSVKDFSSNRIHNIIDQFVKMSPVPMRPKCLLVFWVEDFMHSDTELEQILHYAWSKNFMDFTVLIINRSTSSIFVSYDPFTKNYITQYLHEKSEIFPDKIRDTKQYPLNMPVFNTKPSLWFQTENGKIVEIHGVAYKYVEIIINMLNFRPNFIVKNNFSVQLIGEILVELEENKIQMVPSPFLIDSFLFGKKIIIGNPVLESKIAVIVPVIFKSRFNFTLEILLYIISLPTIIFFFYFSVKILKFEPKEWNILYIYRVLIGIPAEPPPKLPQKIVFIFLAVLSVLYLNFFFSTLEEMKVVNYEKNFNTYQEIVDTKMQVYSAFNANVNDNVGVQKLLNNRAKIIDDEDCVKKLISTRSVVCVLPYYGAKYQVRINLDVQKRPIMKLAKPSFHHQFVSFPYEKASPYAEKFDKIIQQVKESGIMNVQKLKEKMKLHVENLTSSVSNRDVFPEQLFIVLFAGFMSAIVAFLWELVVYYYFTFKL